MRNLVGLVTLVFVPVAVVIVAFKCALTFVEEAIRF